MTDTRTSIEADERVVFLWARLDEDEVAARAAMWDELSGTWTARPPRAVYERYTVAEYCDDVVVVVAPENADGVGRHVARHDPCRVLAEVEAKRALIDDLLAQKHTVVGDDWYTCAAATEERDGGESCIDGRAGGPCDCGRDAHIIRRLTLMTLPYADHPDHKPDWRP